MKRILPLLAAVVVTFALVAVPASAANFDWSSYAGDPMDYGSYELYKLREIMPTFFCNGLPAGGVPTSWTCVHAPWGTQTVDGKAVPTNYLVRMPVGSTVQITVPAVAGLWKLSYTVDGGNTWFDRQLNSDGMSTSYFEFTVPADGDVAYILFGLDLQKEVFRSDFETYLKVTKGLAGGSGSDVSGNLDSLDQEFPSLWPVFDVLDAITMDTAALTTFGAIWSALIPTNGTMYVLISIALAMGVLGFVLFGRK